MVVEEKANEEPKEGNKHLLNGAVKTAAALAAGVLLPAGAANGIFFVGKSAYAGGQCLYNLYNEKQRLINGIYYAGKGAYFLYNRYKGKQSLPQNQPTDALANAQSPEVIEIDAQVPKRKRKAVRERDNNQQEKHSRDRSPRRNPRRHCK